MTPITECQLLFLLQQSPLYVSSPRVKTTCKALRYAGERRAWQSSEQSGGGVRPSHVSRGQRTAGFKETSAITDVTAFKLWTDTVVSLQQFTFREDVSAPDPGSDYHRCPRNAELSNAAMRTLYSNNTWMLMKIIIREAFVTEFH